MLEKIDVLSTISGGSVIGAYYAYTPHKSFDEFETGIKTILRDGFHSRILIELAKPLNLCRCLKSGVLAQLQDAVALLTKYELSFPRTTSRTDMLHRVLVRDVFPGINMDSPRRNNVDVIIGACELRTGTAFRFGSKYSGSWRYGEVVSSKIDVALAVTASAAYPIMLPALDKTWLFSKRGSRENHRVLLTDGGVYDNLGLQVLEPDRDSTISLHTFPCDYLIACNAGHGQESGAAVPRGFVARVTQAFGVIHRRVQDSTMNRLHHLMKANLIKGFALPYLGQLDERLPTTPSSFVERSAVVGYPTDFAKMSDDWIDKLSKRGEQLTRILVPHYLKDLVNPSLLLAPT